MFKIYRRGKLPLRKFILCLLMLALLALLAFHALGNKRLLIGWTKRSSKVNRVGLSKANFSTELKETHILTMKKNANNTIYTGEKMTIFSPGQLYSRMRIPALIYVKGHFIAFCEGRVKKKSDRGAMDILIRRGRQKGLRVEWGEIRVLVHIPDKRTMNPTPVFDRKRNSIILMFIAIHPKLSEKDMMIAGRHQVSLMMIRSSDLGQTWTQPKDVSNQTVNAMQPLPAIYSIGPGHAIQTKSGRIVVPGNVWAKINETDELLDAAVTYSGCISRSNVIYSDDGGDSWTPGGFVSIFDHKGNMVNSNEAQVVETGETTLCLNSRTVEAQQTRYWSCSSDGGQTFEQGRLHDNLLEPGYRIRNGIMTPDFFAGCQGSTVGFPTGRKNKQRGLFFSNPASSVDRMFLSLRLSLDSGKSWSKPLILDPYFAGYTDMSYFGLEIERQSIPAFGILYEHGIHKHCETIDFKIFILGSIQY